MWKNIDARTWQIIDHKVKERKRQRKDTDVIFNGKRLKKSTVEKETARHRPIDVLTQLALSELCSTAPANFVV